MRAARAVQADSPAEPGPESDRIEGAPHPRLTARLFGQEAAEAEFLQALGGGRLHHAWLLTGPRGIGKATLAWRMARLLLSLPVAGAPAASPALTDSATDAGPGLFGDLAPNPAPNPASRPAAIPQSLDIAADHPVARRIAALSEPGLALVRRSLDDKSGALRSQILVDDIRRLKHFFTLTASDGGRRVAIIDCADEMNGNAANALLKLLEEPPPRATLILIAHQPARLLATIRSRCRVLRLAPLGPEAIAKAIAQAQAADPDHPADGALSPADQAGLAALAHGSAGEALRLLAHDGLAIYRQILALLDQAPRIDRLALAALAETAQGRANADRFDMILGLLDLFLARLARGGLGVWGMAPAPGRPPEAFPPEAFPPEAFPGEAALIARLCPDPRAARLWAEAQQALGARARQGRAVNLDPAALLVDMVLQLNAIAGRTAIRG